MPLDLWLPFIFLVAGLFLLLVGFYLRYQSRRLQKAIANLYELNQSVNQDVLDFIDQAWLFLAQNGFQNMHCDLLWYGEPQTLQKGTEDIKAIQVYDVVIEEGGIQLSLRLRARKYRGEKQLLLEMVLKTFEMLLAFDVANKTKQFFLSQKRLEDYQLFVQHDTKNIAQFITLLASQVNQADSVEQKVKLVERLNGLLPSVVLRAKRITDPLLLKSPSFDDIQPMSLKELIQTLAQSMMLPIRIEGDAQVMVSQTLMTQVFHNLLDNFKAHIQGLGQVDVTIERQTPQSVQVTLTTETSADVPKLSAPRLFEPFWTTSKSGLGLGLFIVRALLVKVGGEVHFFQNDHQLGFKVDLPVETNRGQS